MSWPIYLLILLLWVAILVAGSLGFYWIVRKAVAGGRRDTTMDREGRDFE